jgi:magnesium chelatase family protein
VLFLDEMPQFRQDALEALRQPIEDGIVVVARAHGTVRFPAQFALVAAMNPCPCGYRGDLRRECTCTPPQVQRHLARVSGPLLDRIDLHVEVPRPPMGDLLGGSPGESSDAVRARVVAARGRASARVRAVTGSSLRSEGPHARLALDPVARAFLRGAADRLVLGARAAHRVVRVAAAIADLEGTDAIHAQHLAEALQYRVLDRPAALAP